VTAFIPDPRIAATTSTEGEELVIVDRVRIGDRIVDFPRPLPGAPEYAAVVAAEMRAEELRPRLLEDLDERSCEFGEPPWQPNAPLVVNMRSSAGTAVAEAMTGMEAFANHHILRAAPSGSFSFREREFTVAEAFNLPINERYAEVLPQLILNTKPTQTPWWPVFRRIQRLAVLQRHALYEPQSGSGLTGARSLAERLYNGEYRGAAEMMVSAFEHFSPGWLSAERRLALQTLNR
jgi:hypothetical protein